MRKSIIFYREKIKNNKLLGSVDKSRTYNAFYIVLDSPVNDREGIKGGATTVPAFDIKSKLTYRWRLFFTMFDSTHLFDFETHKYDEGKKEKKITIKRNPRI